MSAANPPESASSVGLGYGIAIAVSILVLISTIMLASYACVRVKAGGGRGGGGGGPGRGEISGRSLQSVGGVLPETVVVVGLEGPVIESFPKLVLGESRRLPRPNNGPCSICLSEYKAKDMVRCVPECNHCFHSDCIDEWLRMSATCPLCRNSPSPSAGPTPVATPMSEVTPLPFHAR
ncbi:putative RING-H2 finger protein ATL69 isoform X2 [Malania oleifera]|nr:putative RING-H2 finger protein ATL69 isoform X2 [Malania oleifera]